MDATKSPREPLIYDYTLDVRFGDSDSYGHLNSSRYLDLVATSRLFYIERVMNIKTRDITGKGLGFFMSKASQEFLKPVPELAQVRVTSYLREVDGARFKIPFSMSNPDQSKIYCKGEMEFYVVDLNSNRPINMPDWIVDMFYKKEAKT